MKRLPVSVSLVPSRIQIREKLEGGRGHRFLCDGDFRNGESFSAFMHAFLKFYQSQPSVDQETFSGFKVVKLKTMEVKTVEGATPRTSVAQSISGQVESGKYGIESTLVNVHNFNKIKQRERTDCEFIPFFFLMDFEPKQNSVILLTEQYGHYSPKGVLLDRLQQYVAMRLSPKHKVVSETIVSEEVFKKVLRQRIKALRFHFQRVPADVADDLGNDRHIVQNGEMEVYIKAKNGRFPSWGWNLLQEKRRTGISIGTETSDEMKVEIDMECGKTKTVDIGNLAAFRMSFPIAARDDMQENGHPSDDQMLEEAKDVLKLCRKVLGWRALA